MELGTELMELYSVLATPVFGRSDTFRGRCKRKLVVPDFPSGREIGFHSNALLF